MEHILYVMGIAISMTLNSCYFGAFRVEQPLTDEIMLVAFNDLDEAQITYTEDGDVSYYTLVPPTVFSVGHDDDFIIAKTHPAGSKGIDTALTRYYIIEIEKVTKDNHEEVPALTRKEFFLMRKQLNISRELKFTIYL